MFYITISILTALECVLFWCLALSLALLKALVQPGNSHMYGFSPVWLRRWVFKFSSLEYAFEHPSNYKIQQNTHAITIW